MIRRRIRLALGLTFFGMTVQLLTTLYWTPLTFVLSTVLGIGPIALGCAVFLWTVWRTIEPVDDDPPADGRGQELRGVPAEEAQALEENG
jgi:hypothetical protein